jgi:DNA-binding response OmpR family regulator
MEVRRMKYRQPGYTAIALVIDDDPFIRLLARDALEKIDLKVEEAGDGASGLSAIAALVPDIILLDVMMPDMDGFAVCRQALQIPGAALTPVLMLTALEDTDSINQAYEAGATDFISKPINWSILGHRVRYMLKASALLRTVGAYPGHLIKTIEVSLRWCIRQIGNRSKRRCAMRSNR